MNDMIEKPMFGNVLKIIRANKGISIRRFAELSGFSAAYISDLEKNNRKPSSEVINKIKEKFVLSQYENKLLMDAFFHDRLEIPIDLIYYILNNELVESLRVIKQEDAEGIYIRNLAKSFEENNIDE